MLPVNKFSQIGERIAINVVGCRQQNMFDHEGCPGLLRQRADAGITGRLQRDADAFMCQTCEEGDSLFLALPQHALVVVKVRLLVCLA